MKPEEALYHLLNYGPAYVPAFYRNMERAQLEALVRECDKPSAEQRSDAALTRWAQQRMKIPAWVGMNEAPKDRPEAEAAAAPQPAADPVPEEPVTLVGRAIAKPERLSTPKRRAAAFLVHFARCRTIVEAAARAGVDRRTVTRWRKDPVFNEKCRRIVAARRHHAVENVVLAADHTETRPVFYRGKQVGAYTRRDRTLDLYLLKQADAEALRAEKRREAKDDFDSRVAAEVERRISQMSRFAGHEPAPADDEFTNVANDFDASGRDIAFAP